MNVIRLSAGRTAVPGRGPAHDQFTTSTTFSTNRPGRTAEPVGSSRASWIRRFAAGAGAVMVLGGLSLTLAAPAQAAQASSSHLGATSATEWTLPPIPDGCVPINGYGCSPSYVKG